MNAEWIRKEPSMMKKKLTPLTICHLILMGFMCILSFVVAVMIFTENIHEGNEAVTQAQKIASLLTGIGHCVDAIALACGMVYLLKGSGKGVAGIYQVFLLLVTHGLGLCIAGKLFFPGFDVSAGLMIGSLLMLLILTFGKDLGRTKTWSVFFILLALDLAGAILTLVNREALPGMVSGLARLVMDGTIGLAIRAKYMDKAERGE